MEEMLRDLQLLALASNTLRLLSIFKKVIIGLMLGFAALRILRTALRWSQSGAALQAGLRRQLP